jgi:hypothetical protein
MKLFQTKLESDMQLVKTSRRVFWAQEIRAMRNIAREWLEAALDYPNDTPWQAKCRNEHDRLMGHARQYLKTSRDFAR